MATYDFGGYLRELKNVLDRMPLERVGQFCDVLYNAYLNERAIFLFGNGGSASLASHLACDLGKGTHLPATNTTDMSGVKRLRAISVTDNLPMITAWANDASYEDVFAEQIANFVQAGDVAFGISTSGNSPNVLKALAVAKRAGATTMGITGFQGGKMKELLDWSIVVPAENVQQIEDAHLIIAHLIFLELRRRIQEAAKAT